jgi:hypothetical protein
VNSPGNAERRPQPKGGAPDKQTKTTTTVQYYTTLPLVPALLCDAWVTETVLTVRLRRALALLVTALAAQEGGAV